MLKKGCPEISLLSPLSYYETFAKRRLRADGIFFDPAASRKRLYRLNALGSFAFLTPLEPCCDGGVPRKINKFALQAAFFKGLLTGGSCGIVSRGKTNR